MAGARNHTGHRIGEWHQRAKLTDAQVREIRERNERGEGYIRLARAFPAGVSTIRDICTYRTRASA